MAEEGSRNRAAGRFIRRLDALDSGSVLPSSRGERAKTALVRATILDTDRLRQLGLDMSTQRCKDLFRVSQDFILPSPRNRNDGSSCPPLLLSPGISLSSAVRVVARVNKKTPTTANHFSSMICNFSDTNMTQSRIPMPCNSCQKSDGLAERFHSHDRGPSTSNNSTVHEPKTMSHNEVPIDSDSEDNSTKKPSSLIHLRVRLSRAEQNSNCHWMASARNRPLPTHNHNPDTRSGNSEIMMNQPERMNYSTISQISAEYQPATWSHRPPFLVCHVCGKKFGTASLRIHLPQCLLKQERELMTGNEGLSSRKKEGTATVLNRRTHHTLAANNGSSSKDKREHMEPRRTTTFRPILCYICGREFGSHSIAIHQPQCLQKWHWNNDKLPSNLRQSEPTLPTF